MTRASRPVRQVIAVACVAGSRLGASSLATVREDLGG
jgi:hypothetical protein